MTRRALAIAAFGLAGCFLSHERVDDGAPMDAGTPRRDASPSRRDAGVVPMRDSGPPPAPDAGDMCMGPITPGRTNRFCILDPSGAIEPGAPRPLPVWHDGCFCEDTLSCTTTVTGGIIDVRTLVCRTPEGCDECGPTIQTTCILPPLTTGDYLVRIDGVEVADVSVARPEPGTFARPVCYDAPDPGSSASIVCGPRLALGRVARVCRPGVSDVGSQPTIRVTEGCAGCFDRSGGCEVALEPGRLVVEPRRLACECPACGGCGMECTAIEISCHPPPLAAGEYELVVGGRVTGERLVVRDIIPGTMPPPEECF